ncbi:Homeodomain-like domain-containing protein [Nocardia farcinica]|uniref:RNA polymerase sigma factor, sigma-70 family n=1 Tax=Nocardia farcinica TaxID=37329 RepID=A0A0H5NEG4_NOCFR|nr:helix-turn-helix domain-containing protein [Nocardia farcinica]AXK88872.1 hypothetical protein DXT66_27470 [Nocardia farcinica]PFX03998.1 hypothetical protein CJ469_01872 [Nocardia farcinica]PFX10156.1 hypothetical protein CJ468_01003 [Nocardia farcinica]CRY73704.1 RNA polymerase sigma factor%2C sigma-70 family [Nocardia farcinica]SIT24754.1 Homeodomain-like domain-containing protein [Nocardia farcinica]
MSDKVRSQWKPLGQKKARYTLAMLYPGQPGYTDTTPVVAHLRQLNGWGLSLRSIAADAGMHEESVRQILAGESTTMRTRFAVALLEVSHTPNPRQGRVLAIGATRRLCALQALGWPLAQLAIQTGVPAKSLWSIAYRNTLSISYTVWAAVRDVYEQLSATPGPDVRRRNRAVESGTPAPLDWEGYDIDDPRVTVAASGPPAPPTRAQVAAERRFRCAELDARGLSTQEIADQLGVTTRTVERIKAELRQAAE